MRRLLWTLAGLFVFAQAVFFLALLVWPGGADLGALMLRLAAWEAAGALAVQIFFGAPALIALFWGARRGLARGLIALAFLATCGLLVLAAWEIDALHYLANDSLAPRGILRGLGLARWADAGLGLFALIALRLAWRAEGAAAGHPATA